MGEEFLSRKIVASQYGVGERSVQEHRELRVKKECEEIPEARKMLETVDFEVLRSILLEQLKRAGITEEQINFLPADRILFNKQFGAVRPHGEFDPLANLIIVNYYRLLEMSPEAIKTLFLRTVIHEEVHAISKSVCRVDGYGTTETIEVGVARQDMRSGSNDFVLFEEGITERFSREILAEYQLRVGETPTQNKKGVASMAAYENCLRIVDLFILRVSEKRGVPVDVVWQALLEAKFRGRDFSEGDLWSELNEVFSTGVMQKIKENKLKAALAEIESTS